jgi:hypothetical protein
MVAPCRVADSRDWSTLTTFFGYQTEDLVIGGHCGVPLDAAGVILNVTMVPIQDYVYNPGGFLTIYPVGADRPNVSQATYTWGNNSTEATVMMGDGGGVSIFNGSAGRVEVIIDAAAYIVK